MGDLDAKQSRAVREFVRAFSQLIRDSAKPKKELASLVDNFPGPSPLQRKILEEIPRACVKAVNSKAPEPILNDILAVVGSWGDTIKEEEVLAYLRAIAISGSLMVEIFASNID
jgi:hypothetical protein